MFEQDFALRTHVSVHVIKNIKSFFKCIDVLEFCVFIVNYRIHDLDLQVNYVKRSSFDFVTHLEFSSLALQI
jgi:hypothetical protein